MDFDFAVASWMPDPFRMWFEAVQQFFELGGGVLLVIALLTFVMWGLVFERIIYLHTNHHQRQREIITLWEGRQERKSWHAHRVREQFVSEVSLGLQRNLILIKALVMLCPLLGLLGTVTGMIEVFEGISMFGSGDVRSVASGVSKATIPTMAGMVSALSGLFVNAWLQRISERERAFLSEQLTMDH